MALYSLAVSCAGLVGQYAGPIALQNISWKYYIVYICWDLFECVMIWFFAVETKGRTLEELDEIFEVGVLAGSRGSWLILAAFQSPNPVKESLSKHKVAIVKESDHVEMVQVDGTA
ncbi:hypothetical protein V5O48_013100 [Marasmius crinis-equi]|uniref:Major facilitator superfamily (MFS) profile domain-containing protein n=1 Tax=Marasmius crinis-equi TaxID=585013 RepID=A0ABR3F1C3_9AGAR